MRLVQPGTLPVCAGELLVNVDAVRLDAEVCERLALQLRVLVVGGAPRVSCCRCRRSQPSAWLLGYLRRGRRMVSGGTSVVFPILGL